MKAASTKDIKAALVAEFPGWSFMRVRPSGDWWAMRTGRHRVSEVVAATPEELRAELRAVIAAELPAAGRPGGGL